MTAATQLISDSLRRLRLVTADVSVFSHLSYREYLQALHQAMKATAESYSYLQFAEDLGFSKSNVLWLVVSGRRKLSSKASGRIVDALDLRGNDRRYFLTLVRYCNARRPDDRQALLEELLRQRKADLPTTVLQENLEYYSEWFHPVIREMTSLADFQSDPHWIAEKLAMKILPKQAEKSLRLLEELNLIRFDAKKKRHYPTGEAILPDRTVSTLAAVRYHQQMCEIASEALTRVSAANREYNTITICVSKEEAMEIGALIHELCERIVRAEQKAKKKDQVFQVNLQLFPLTKDRAS